LDYIQSPDIEKRFKTPNYWAHLVLTGIPENKSGTLWWLWIIIIAGILGVLSYLMYYVIR
jgi:hypothetical protein